MGRDRPRRRGRAGGFPAEREWEERRGAVAVGELLGRIAREARDDPAEQRDGAIPASADCEEVKPEVVSARAFRGPEPAQRALNGATSRSDHAVGRRWGTAAQRERSLPEFPSSPTEQADFQQIDPLELTGPFWDNPFDSTHIGKPIPLIT